MSSQRIGVVGCGLMGTSIAMAALRTGDGVRGWDTDQTVLDRSASRSGLERAGNLAAAVVDADLVFVCAPMAAIPELVHEALAAAPFAVVADAGSVKSRVVNEVHSGAPPESLARFVGSHPMGGSERAGPEGASASFLDGAVWVLTPTAETAPASTALLEKWVRKIGAKPVVMDPVKHDRVVALVSHLPQVVSTVLMGLASRQHEDAPETLVLAAGGFRDLTRLAASNPQLWAGILRSNREELSRAIDLFIEDLVSLKRELGEAEPAGLQGMLAEATKARLALAARPKVRAGVAILQVPIPDLPGALADLTLAMSERGVNIEDLQIVHSPEGGRGTVHLTVAGADVGAALEAATAHGLEPFRIA